MGIKDLIFGRKKVVTIPQIPADVREDLIAVIQSGIANIMMINFAMMDMEAQSIPTTGSTGNLRSRGYILGMTQAITAQFSEMNPTEAEFVTALASAFAVTYGSYDWNWALDAADSLKAGDPAALAGAKLGHRDVEMIYSGQPYATPTGFWLLNNGDEEALVWNLNQL